MSAAKRQRVDDGPLNAEPIAKIRSNIWFTDGNIILEAEGTQFRVHRGVLAKHSSVFNDMFNVPQPPDECTVEGCSVIQLSDTARDVEHLLNILYDWITYSSKALPVPVVSTMIRLGHKYDFVEIRKEALSRLTEEYPPYLEKFVESPKYTRICESGNPEILDLFALAGECKLHALLPSLGMESFFDYSSEETFEGIPRLDGSLYHLSQEEKLIWTVGHSKARGASADCTFKWLKSVPYEGCSTIQKCKRDAHTVFFSLFFPYQPPRKAGLCGVFLWDAALYAAELCNHCSAAAQKEHEEGLSAFWEAVPSFFGLPPWSDLKNFDF